MQDLWAFLSNPANQTTLGWLGGGLVVVFGGLWAVVQFFAKKPESGAARPSVSADHGSVTIGRDSHAPINVNKPPPAPRAAPKK